MMKSIWVALLIVLGLTMSAHADMVPGSKYSAGNWVGGAFYKTGTTRFQACAAGADYQGGLTVSFGMNVDGWVLTLYRETWKYPVGDQNVFPVGYAAGNGIAGSAPDTVQTVGIPATPQIIMIPLAPDRQTYDMFLHNKSLHIMLPTGQEDINIKNILPALRLTYDCMMKYVAPGTHPKLGDTNPFK